MTSIEYAPPVYPVIKFLVTRGYALAILLGLIPLAASVWLVSEGGHVAYIAAGAFVGAMLWLVFRSYVEVLRIIADTLMPR